MEHFFEKHDDALRSTELRSPMLFEGGAIITKYTAQT